MKQNDFQRSVSAYLFAMTVTIIGCLFAAGLVYIDLCTQDALLSAEGVLYPLLDAVMHWVERWFAL